MFECSTTLEKQFFELRNKSKSYRNFVRVVKNYIRQVLGVRSASNKHNVLQLFVQSHHIAYNAPPVHTVSDNLDQIVWFALTKEVVFRVSRGCSKKPREKFKIYTIHSFQANRVFIPPIYVRGNSNKFVPKGSDVTSKIDLIEFTIRKKTFEVITRGKVS